MNSKTTNFLAFTFGLTVGMVGTYFAIKRKYESMIQEEIDSVKAFYDLNHHEFVEMLNDSEEPEEKSEVKTTSNTEDNVSDKIDIKDVERPYIINEYEFNEIYGYECFTLTLYSNGVLADEEFEKIDDIDEIVGKDNFKKLQDGNEDCIYVRNDSKYSDYEIIKSQNTYEEELRRHLNE